MSSKQRPAYCDQSPKEFWGNYRRQAAKRGSTPAPDPGAVRTAKAKAILARVERNAPKI